jgi:transcriptional regulator with GAF, ATPase, and Fis domain
VETEDSDAGDDLTPLERAERETILEYLKKNNYNQAAASRDVGIRPNTMITKMRRYRIKTPVGITRPGRKPKAVPDTEA